MREGIEDAAALQAKAAEEVVVCTHHVLVLLLSFSGSPWPCPWDHDHGLLSRPHRPGIAWPVRPPNQFACTTCRRT